MSSCCWPAVCCESRERCWTAFRDGAKSVANAAYQIIATMAPFIIAGIALQFLFPPLALPFYMMAAGIMMSMLTVKMLDGCGLLERFKKHALDYEKYYRVARWVCFVAAVIVAPFNPIAAVAIAGAVGLFAGATMDAARSLK